MKRRYWYWMIAAATPVLVVTGVASAPAYAAFTPLPAHVYAPYYETYLAPNTASLTATAQASGTKYFSLAFLQATAKGSCSINWNSNASQPLDFYNTDIASLRALGGDVIPTFGGYSADHGGTEIADTCTDVNSIAADYESVISTLGVTRLDMDVESASLNDTAGINRRNEALAMAQQWAAAQNPPISLQVTYTLPVEQYGLDPNGEAVLQNAVADGVKVTTVNIMVFDYYIAKEGIVEMGQAAVNAATSTNTQLQSIFGVTSAQAYAMEGMTLLPGIDDRKQKNEVTSEADATTMLNFAQANNLNFLSIWAIQRDNGGCPGSVDSNTCSGITQNDWDFSHILQPFTG